MTGRGKICLLILALASVSGCASISKGVTEALMEREVVDQRRCWITGRSFKGLDDLFRTSMGEDAGTVRRLKVMTVHGIGSHAPGYSRRLLDSLVAQLGLTNMAEQVKTIPLTHPDYEGDLGVLSVYRYMNNDLSREVLFYELTWDSIVEGEMRIIDYDSSQEAGAKRAPLNHTMKTFLNKSIPDALIYNTAYRTPVQIAVAQSACWMLTEKWSDLPHGEARYCDASRPESWLNLGRSEIAIISHSLGSRISLDAIQQTILSVARQPELQDISRRLKYKPVHLFMLSNQLPLLQVGQPLPEVHDRIKEICRENGAHYEERLLDQLQIVAFSDPNDLFSYTVKPEYIERYVDSRLCPTITNVVLEVASVTSLLGTGAFANPQSAHTEYEADSRVLQMLVSGLGTWREADEIRQRCSFIETIPDD